MSEQAETRQSIVKWLKIVAVILGYSAWVAAAFVAAIVVVGASYDQLQSSGGVFDGISTTALNVILGVVTYGLTLLIAIGLPWVVKRHVTDKVTLGIDKHPQWKHIGLALGGIAVYYGLSIALAIVVSMNFTGIDMTEQQDLSGISPQSTAEIVTVFALLVVIGPIAEEVLFRGYLYGKLRRVVPFWLTALVVSLLFGAVHLQWNVAIDTFALSIVMCLTRELSGSLWPSILMHMSKNGLAFYILFMVM